MPGPQMIGMIGIEECGQGGCCVVVVGQGYVCLRENPDKERNGVYERTQESLH